jgi:DNA-directed RNA polymerase specialized sigma24 family protein
MKTDLDELAEVAHRIAARVSADAPDLYDDAKQEAMIAGWRELADGAPVSHAVMSMKYRALQIREGRRPIGSPASHRMGDALDKAGPIVKTLDDGEEVLVAEPVESPLAFEVVEGSDVAARVRRVLAGLDPRDRDYVFLRFWRGLTATEIARATGVSAASSSVRWSRHLRPALAEALSGVRA